MDLGVGRQLSYASAKRLLVVTGLVVLGATAAVLYVRRVETTEVVAVLLFVPVYLAVVTGKVRGGVIAALAAAGVYAALRLGGVDAYDSSQQMKLVFSRAAAYLAFGVVGGLAVRHLEAALRKLDRYDLVDDDTGLYNARFAAGELQLELARGTRYGSVFSVVELSGPVGPLRALRRSPRSEALRVLGSAVVDTLRQVDRASVAQDGDRFVIVAVMPETPAAGAGIVAERLSQAVGDALAAAGAPLGGEVVSRAMSFPADGDGLEALRQRMAALDALEHPQSA